MDDGRFDALTRSLATTSRRNVMKALAGGVLAAAIARLRLAPAAAQATADQTCDPSAVVFADDFESGDLGRWASVNGLAIDDQELAAGAHAARATSAGVPAFATATLSAPQTDLYYRLKFKLLRRDTGVSLLAFRTSEDQSLLEVFVDAHDRLSYRNDVAKHSNTGHPKVKPNEWHELQVHLQLDTDAATNGRRGQVEVWYDGEQVADLSRPERLGTSTVAAIQLGDSVDGDRYDVAFDDLVVATQFVPAAGCGPWCPPGTKLCAGACVDAASGCGGVKPGGIKPGGIKPGSIGPSTGVIVADCVGGCPAGQLCCNGACVASDENNCNACGKVCPNGFANATVTCNPPGTYGPGDAGGCEFKCLDGFADCDGDYHNGCEGVISTANDQCGISCYGFASCASGQHCSSSCLHCIDDGLGTSCQPIQSARYIGP